MGGARQAVCDRRYLDPSAVTAGVDARVRRGYHGFLRLVGQSRLCVDGAEESPHSIEHGVGEYPGRGNRREASTCRKRATEKDCLGLTSALVAEC